jgi:hypothetical protein
MKKAQDEITLLEKEKKKSFIGYN